jgi:hypothetical protein
VPYDYILDLRGLREKVGRAYVPDFAERVCNLHERMIEGRKILGEAGEVEESV